jgi:hypothetical protein
VRRVGQRDSLVVDEDVRVVVGGLGGETQPDDKCQGLGKAFESELLVY